jgi:hypothetical protein
LVDEVVAGRVPGMDQGSSQQRLRWLFRDNVHLAPTGIYFMGLVHYAVLFGQTPEGAVAPNDVPAAALRHLQQLAWEHAQDYAELAASAAERGMSACREYAAYTMCPAFAAHRGVGDAGLVARFSRMREVRRCQDHYLDRDDPKNPFRELHR